MQSQGFYKRKAGGPEQEKGDKEELRKRESACREVIVGRGVEKERFEDATWVTSKMVKETMSQGMEVASRS